MNAGDFFALCALIFGIISVVAILASAYKRNLDFKQRQLELQVKAAAAQTAQPADRSDLEERVRVLERIATDRAPELASQIEALRDLGQAERLLEERSN